MCAVSCCFCVFCGGEGNAHAACWVRDGFSKEPDVGFFNGEGLGHTVERDPCGVDTTVDDGRRTGRGERDVDRQTEDGAGVELEFGEALGGQSDQASVVGAGRDFGEVDVVTGDRARRGRW